jgi:acyl-CoA synthetase (AMP-forming)/AMP-acid ligase II
VATTTETGTQSLLHLSAEEAQGPSRIDLLSEDTFGGLLMRTVMEHSRAKAIVDQVRSVTYTELGAAAWSLARALAGAGVAKGTRVAVLMPNSAEWLASSFAVALNGGVIVPISTMATPEERDHILRFSDASVLLTETRSGPRALVNELAESYPFLSSALPGAIASAQLPHLRRVFVHGLEATGGAFEAWNSLLALADKVPSEVIEARAAAVTPYDDAIVYFTSGSTSKPKAVLHMHRGPVTTMRAMAGFQGLARGETLLGGKQFFWVGMTSTVGACLASGATYVGMERFDAELALQLIERERVNVVNCSPHQLEQIGRAAEARKSDLSSLRLVEPSRLSSAAGLPEEHEYLIGYGMTETAGVVCSLPGNAPLESRRNSNGRPLETVEIRIVDVESGQPLPTGATGVVQIKGTTVMRGYLKQAPETGFSDGYLATQDLGSLDDSGYFHYKGRTSGLIKTNGANVSRQEVEEAVRRWDGLDDGFVVGIPHPTLGEAVVLVAIGDEAGFVPAALEAHLRSSLAAFKLPKRIVFMAADAVPRTAASDKVDYPRLQQHVEDLLIASDPNSQLALFLAKSRR